MTPTSLHQHHEFGAWSVPQGGSTFKWDYWINKRRSACISHGPRQRAPSARPNSAASHAPDRDARKATPGRRAANYEPSGFVYTFDVPMASLTSAAA